MSPQMSADSLKDNLTNPARSYLWEILFANPLGGDTETLLLRATSTTQPGVSVGKIHIPFKQTGGIEYAGKKTYSHSWTCEFVEGEDRAILDALYAWSQAVVNDNTGLSSAVTKTDAYLHLINTDGSVAKKIKLVGTFLESILDLSLSQDAETEIKYSATWSYDRWELVD